MTAPATATPGARPLATVDKRQRQKLDSKKNLKIDNRTYLVVTNTGSGDATNVRLSWENPDDAPMVHGLEDPIGSLVSGANLEFEAMVSFGNADHADLKIDWVETDGAERTSLQTLRF